MPDDIRAGSQDARMTRRAALTTLAVLVLTGAQSRHNWPLGVADGIYVAAFTFIVLSYFRIYRRAVG